MSHRLSERRHLITGAARGIGFAIATRLVAEGARVMLADVLAEGAERAAELGEAAAFIHCDVTSRDQIEAAITATVERWGGLDGLINNAGISQRSLAIETQFPVYQKVVDVDLLAPIALTQEILPRMATRKSGRLVFISSVAGKVGSPMRTAYSAAKHGLIGLTRTLAAEWGGRGVRVNAVCPGWIKTEMDVADQGSGAYGDDDIINRVPMARFAKPDDVARAIAFLAEGDGFLNGVSLPVDGGWTGDMSWDALRLKTR